MTSRIIAGEGDKATTEPGRVLTDSRIDDLVRALKAVKATWPPPRATGGVCDRVKE